MLVKIPRSQIHHLKDGENDALQFDLILPEYPDLPTYGIRIDLPTTKAQIRQAIIDKIHEAKAQIQRDEAIRTLFDDFLDTDIEV